MTVCVQSAHQYIIQLCIRYSMGSFETDGKHNWIMREWKYAELESDLYQLNKMHNAKRSLEIDTFLLYVFFSFSLSRL